MELRLARLRGDFFDKKMDKQWTSYLRPSIERVHFCDFNLKKKKEQGKQPLLTDRRH